MARIIHAVSHKHTLDLLIGFLVCPFLNVAIWLAMSALLAWAEIIASGTRYYTGVRLYVLLLPWIINGIVIVLAFLFRPYVGIGYIACIGLVTCSGAASSVLFLCACFGIIGLALVLSAISNLQAGWLIFILPLVALLLLLGLGLGIFIVVWRARHK